ncbi:MAG: aldehyde ferredoxin oxidoreductase family protein [Promethearchaeota archaeon]
MSKGIYNKILWIDLSHDSFEEKELSDEILRQYIGGYGLAAKLIYDNMPAKADPLGPEAIMGFFPGLLTDTGAPFSGRFMIAGKSPLTGGWGDSNCGGYFGPEIKKCGYDAILIKGIASSPKYITIIDGQKQILDALDLWGLDCIQTEEKLKEKHGRGQLASIGQSGEKISLISGIVNDKGRIAARSGLGAVMGSKKLKAIMLKGNQKVDLTDRDALLNLTRNYNESLKGNGVFLGLKTYGTTIATKLFSIAGDTPIKNWGGTVPEDFSIEKLDKISGTEILKYKQKSYGCSSCPIQCGAICKVPEIGIEETHRPEYETCGAFGTMLLNDDLMSLFTINDLCNRAGIDTISTGGTVAFAIECYENGILTKDEIDGLELTWGNSSAIIELVKKMIKREGIGDILADGSKVASEKIGKGSEKFAIHAGGQELGMHKPTYTENRGAAYAFDPTPGRHTTAKLEVGSRMPIIKPNKLFEGFQLPRKIKQWGEERNEAKKLVIAQYQVTCSLGLCEFLYYFPKYPLVGLINAATGWDITIEEIIKTGLRIQTLRQAFSLREGIDIINIKLPKRAAGVDYLGDYRGTLEKLGWNTQNAYPLKETLTDLNLDFVIKDLY